MPFDYEILVKNKDIIIENLNNITINLSKIKNKILYINKIYKKLERNSLLKFDNLNNNNLLFQNNVLENEYNYYKNHFDLILSNFCNQLYELNQNILYILFSLKELEIDSILKKSIFSKISNQKKSNSYHYSYCNELIFNAINNLKVLDELLKLFNTYVLKINKMYKKNNIHNDNFRISVQQKHESILKQYILYCEKFKLCVNYFKNYTNGTLEQIDSSKILNIFLRQ